jgi:hypothetical protein
MEIIAQLIALIIKHLIPALTERTVVDAQSQPDVRRKLTERIKAHWAILLLVLCVGCTRTVYVPHGEPVRLRETVKNVKVWIMVDGNEVPGRIDLHEGWYALPLVEEDTNGE